VSLLFIDTGGFYALADRRDPAHARARRFYETCERPCVTTDYIFAETMSLLTKRLGKRVAVTFGDGLRRSHRIRLEEVAPEMREAAWTLFSTQLDKGYDLIDCTSFAFMDASSIRDAFGFDRHFVQYGMRLLPDDGHL
jgi:predicted nucleic acid-binding protein